MFITYRFSRCRMLFFLFEFCVIYCWVILFVGVVVKSVVVLRGFSRDGWFFRGWGLGVKGIGRVVVRRFRMVEKVGDIGMGWGFWVGRAGVFLVFV